MQTQTTIELSQHLPLVQKVAKRVARRLPSAVQLDELIGAGTLGLIAAAERFDPARADRFEPYAEIRIKGAILDALRAMDWLPRADRARVRRGERSASLEAMVSIEDVRDDGFDGFGDDAALADDRLEHGQRKQRLADAFAALPARQREVLSLYYVHEMTLKEIGARLGVTESRVCQIHGQAVATLRGAFADA